MVFHLAALRQFRWSADRSVVGKPSSGWGGPVSRIHYCAVGSTETETVMRPAILVVDDDPEVREVVAEFLEDFGYQVLQAGGGVEALGVLAQTSDVRMLITDVRMPDMSGLELADVATQRQHDLKVILISGYFMPQPISRRFLRKPFRMSELQAAVQAELNG